MQVGQKRIYYLSTGPTPILEVLVVTKAVQPGFDTVQWANIAAFGPCS
jgi:hypothetical protein